MKIYNEMILKNVLLEIANRIKNYRIGIPLTQAKLAELSGISIRNIVRIEKGEDTQFSNIVKILNIFNLQNNLDVVLPDISESPIYKLNEEKNKIRKRATKKIENNSFKWGDEK